MKILQVVDLLRHQLIRIESPVQEEDFVVGNFVLLQNERDRVVGKVVSLAREVPNAKVSDGYEFLGILKESDLVAYRDRAKNEHERVLKAKEIVAESKLDMQMFASRTDYDGNVYSFFFTSEEKIDFRDFLKKLGREFQTRIHLQRVGARDRAKILSGYGSCGRETCCSSFKIELDSVPLDAARDQNLMTRENEKLFGPCGKLKCCLMYELPLYREMRKYLPHIRQAVMTKDGKEGRVVGLDILNQKVKILLIENDIADVYDIADIKPRAIKNMPSKRDSHED
jgi:cell fate regulator YaaT (PSP1 superfamily)